MDFWIVLLRLLDTYRAGDDRVLLDSSEMVSNPTHTVNIEQARLLCGVSRRTIYYWIEKGKVQYVRTKDSTRIFVDSLKKVRK